MTKGMYFVEMQNNKPVAHGRIGAQVNADYVFAQFDSPVKYGQVITIARLSGFALFQNTTDLQAFVASFAAPSVPAGTPQKVVDESIELSAS